MNRSKESQPADGGDLFGQIRVHERVLPRLRVVQARFHAAEALRYRCEVMKPKYREFFVAGPGRADYRRGAPGRRRDRAHAARGRGEHTHSLSLLCRRRDRVGLYQFNQVRHPIPRRFTRSICRPRRARKSWWPPPCWNMGALDILINNASSFYPTPVGQITLPQWDDLMGSNLKAPLFLSQAAAPSLAKQRGLIINMIDIHALRPLKAHPVYSTAKADLRC